MFLRFHSLDQYKALNIIIEEEFQSGQGALWLGDYTAAMDKNGLKQKGIKTVLTVAQGLGISYVESANILRIWEDTYNQIEQGLKKGGVLVHCAAGVSRSASTVIAYLMRKRQIGFNDAYNYVKARRPVICPNIGFQRQLKQFENQITKKSSTPINEQKIRESRLQQSEPKKIIESKIIDVLSTNTVKKSGLFIQDSTLQQTQKKIFSSIQQKSPFFKQELLKSRQLESKSIGRKEQIQTQQQIFRPFAEKQDKQLSIYQKQTYSNQMIKIPKSPMLQIMNISQNSKMNQQFKKLSVQSRLK